MGTDVNFSKIESRDLLQSKNQKLARTYFSGSHPFLNTIDWPKETVESEKD